nr:hypothetical protein [uncultured bacterium]
MSPDDEVDVVIDTTQASRALGLPESLRGKARVRRVEEQQGGWQKVALVFAPALAQSMELAFFMAFLCGLQGGGAAPAMA